MQSAYLESIGRLVLQEAPMPEIADPDEVLIQVKMVGVCGSEVHAFEGTHPFRLAPVILGHEMPGVVAAVGADVTRFKAGDRALDLIKKRGTVVLAALLTAEPLNFMGFKVVIKEANLTGCTMANHDDVEQAIELAASKADDAIKVLLAYNGEPPVQ